jgi:putative ABC transport system permease protein
MDWPGTDWFGDVRLGLRSLAKNPGFTAVAIAMLALGIGVNATVFTVADAVLFKGFPSVAGNDRLLYISNGGCCISYPDFQDIRAQAKSFQGMGITHGIGSVLNDGAGNAQRIEVTEVSAGTFKTVGRRPILGRDFAPSDQAPGAAPVAIVSHGFWVSRYGKDPNIVGRTIRRDGALATIVGVMPEGFSFPQVVDMWVPLVETAPALERGNAFTWFAFGRLRDGVPWASARAEVEGIIRRLETEYPVTDRRQHLVVQNFAQFFIGDNASAIYGSMWGAVGFVLLIACANLANLMLARALGRSREISVRIALGAGRWRIIRQLLVESVMLSCAGGALGWWLAKWGVHAYALAMAQKESWLILDYAMDGRVLWYLVAVSIATGVLFGLAPALRLARLDVNLALKDGGRGAIGTRGGGRARHLPSLLVSAEMAMAVALLAGAGVMIRSFLKIHTANIGVKTENMLVGAIDPPAARYPDAASRISFFDRVQTRLASLPEVESVAIAQSLPSWGSPRLPYERDGDAPAGERGSPKVSTLVVGPRYFQTFDAALLAGRDFNDHDDASGLPVAIVNDRLASEFWPGEDALGKRIRLIEEKTPDGSTHGAWRTVVGIASNIIQNDEARQRFDPVVYVPYRQKSASELWVVARTRVAPGALVTAYRREVQAIDPDLPIFGPMLLVDRLERFWDTRFYGALFLIFAVIALLLASVGLYTVIAHSVSQRTQEIGVRMAIGATAGDIRRLVLRQGMLPLGAGLAIGLAGSLGVNRILASELVRVSPGDPLTLALAAAALILAATLGCLIPARRAMRVDPVVALRHE